MRKFYLFSFLIIGGGASVVACGSGEGGTLSTTPTDQRPPISSLLPPMSESLPPGTSESPPLNEQSPPLSDGTTSAGGSPACAAWCEASRAAGCEGANLFCDALCQIAVSLAALGGCESSLDQYLNCLVSAPDVRCDDGVLEGGHSCDGLEDEVEECLDIVEESGRGSCDIDGGCVCQDDCSECGCLLGSNHVLCQQECFETEPGSCTLDDGCSGCEDACARCLCFSFDEPGACSDSCAN
jgi:hypothetical protein